MINSKVINSLTNPTKMRLGFNSIDSKESLGPLRSTYLC